MKNKPRVIHIQRKRRPGSNFSLEFIFDDVRNRLKEQFDISQKIVSRHSNGIIKRVLNILEVANLQGDVFHVTGDIHYVTYLLKKQKTILTILDCGFIRRAGKLKGLLLKWFWLDLPVLSSAYITTISESSKKDIIHYTNCHPDKILIIPVAVDEIYQPAPKPFNEVCPVLLHIGTAPNKNLVRLIEAIKDISCKLVIVGRLSDSHKSALEKFKTNYENKTNLSQEEMYQQYCDCDIVTFISEFEGFGMPIVEANCTERPVITGKTSSMPEVGADAAAYANAFSVDDMRKELQRLINDSAYRQNLVKKGRTNKRRFSNETIAQQYAKAYQKILSGS